jgi:hypothetical protein
MHTILEQHNVSSSSFIDARSRARSLYLEPREVIRVKELIGYQSNSIPTLRRMTSKKERRKREEEDDGDDADGLDD